MRSSGLIWVALLIALSLSACGGSDGSGPPDVTPIRFGEAEESPPPDQAVRLSPEPSQTPAATPTPTPSPTPHPEVLGDVQVVPGHDRVYTTARIQNRISLVALSAVDGTVVHNYPTAGTFAVDVDRGHIYVDDPGRGLTVLDIESGESLNTVLLPPPSSGVAQAPPQLATELSQIFVFRDGIIHVISLDTLDFERTLFTDVRFGRSQLLPVAASAYEPDTGLLYLTFSHADGDELESTIVALDAETGEERGRSTLSDAHVADMDSTLIPGGQVVISRYGTGADSEIRLHRWAGFDEELVSSRWPARIETRAIYSEQTNSLLVDADDALLLFEPQSLSLVRALPKPDGRLIGIDEPGDRIYFLTQNGRLISTSFQEILAQPALPDAIDQFGPTGKSKEIDYIKFA